DKIRIEITSLFFKARIIGEEEMERAAPSQEQLAVQHATVSAFSGAGTTQGQMAQQAAMDSVGSSKPRTVKRDRPKIGRNDPCYCGSGKKYKHCCGRTGG
ncbi:MAG: SEC-C metal-binding domain-containing protein, partial [Gemmatimonadota bacterium]|nr:SEC-C metal-binding domain-containing protein [Gemmatimonadota bacterium]